MNTLIQNGRIIDPANGVDEVADIGIKKSKIVGIGSQIPDSFKADNTIDAENH